MAYFGMISVFLALLSAAFFLPVFIEYLQTGLVTQFPTLIVCGFVIQRKYCSAAKAPPDD